MKTNTETKTQNKYIKSLKEAFPHTVPILAGFLFLGMTYGIYMNVSGFNFVYPMLMSMTIFAGSVEFVTVNLLLGSFDPVQAFVMALMLNARHIFYGISMLDKFKGTGLKKIYLIFGMCDETFSVNYTADVPKDVDRGWFMFFVTLLNQIYWVAGATLGGIFGSFITFDTKGLEFVMTAMFVVIFLEQWLKDKNHFPALIGLGLSVLSLAVFGSSNFMLPAMFAILAALTILRKPFEKKAVKQNDRNATDNNGGGCCFCYDADTLYSIRCFSRGKADSEIYFISRNGTSVSDFRFACRLLSQRCEHILGKPRVTRTHCNSRRCRSSSAEKANAAFHSGRNSMLYAARSIRFQVKMSDWSLN